MAETNRNSELSRVYDRIDSMGNSLNSKMDGVLREITTTKVALTELRGNMDTCVAGKKSCEKAREELTEAVFGKGLSPGIRTRSFILWGVGLAILVFLLDWARYLVVRCISGS